MLWKCSAPASDHYGTIVVSTDYQQQVRQQITEMALAVTDEIGYQYGPEYDDGSSRAIDPQTLDKLNRFLKNAKDKHIFVIGFIPPMPHAVYAEMQKHPNASYAEAFRELPGVLKEMYAKYGFDFYDFLDPASFGGSDNEMVNASHGSEKMYLKLFIQIAQESPALGPFVDLDYLKESLSKAKNDYEVFPLYP